VCEIKHVHVHVLWYLRPESDIKASYMYICSFGGLDEKQ
jgi:hypothetical protein